MNDEIDLKSSLKNSIKHFIIMTLGFLMIIIMISVLIFSITYTKNLYYETFPKKQTIQIQKDGK